MRDRLILFALVLALWLFFKAADFFITGPELLFLLGGAIAIMSTHTVWLASAQRKWRKRTRREEEARLARQADGSKTDDTTISDWSPSVDIFIAAKNEARVIASTIHNLFRLDYADFNIWVIDDCSTDDTALILNKLQQQYPRLKTIHRQPGSYPGKSAALNDALPLSRAEVIAVFDADANVQPEFLKQTLPLLEADGVGALQVQKRMYEHQKGLLVDCQSSEYALDTYFQMGRDLIGGVVELRGNGQLIKRAALVDVGGWNNKAITDDLDLSMRLLISNWDIRFCPHAHVFEEAVPNLKGLLRQRRRWAEGSIRRYLDYIFPLNSPARLSFVERLDTLVFTVYFVVPALILLEATSNVVRFTMGVPTYGKFLALGAMLVFAISHLNFCFAVRTYRGGMALWKLFAHCFVVNSYVYLHWVPCIVIAFCQIIFARQTSTWHRTEHVGHAISATD